MLRLAPPGFDAFCNRRNLPLLGGVTLRDVDVSLWKGTGPPNGIRSV